MSYSLFHCHSVYSLLDGYSDPYENAKRAKELGIKALNISDHGNSFGHIYHLDACKKFGIKPILGSELYCCFEPAFLKTDRANTHMVIWAKNKIGLMNLWKLTTQASSPEYFYYKPRIQLWNYIDEAGKLCPGLEEFTKDGNIQGFSGHMGSHLSSNLFADLFGDSEKRQSAISSAYNSKKASKNPEYFKKFLKSDWLESTCELALKIEKIFGKGNFFIELQNELNEKDKVPLYICPLIVDCLREVSKQTGIMACASSDPHYARKEDSIDQRLMISVNMRLNEDQISEKINDSEDDTMVFFTSDNFYIHSYEEMALNFTKEELENTNKIADQIEEYDLKSQPYFPEFSVPDFPRDLLYLRNIDGEANKYLMYLCVEGIKKRKPWEKSGKKKEEYWERLKSESEIIFKVGLAGYFLIVHDMCMAADNRPKNKSFDWQKNFLNKGEIDPIARGIGRGSAAGCLISYCTTITDVDPLKYKTMFNRFYNAGRISKDNVSPCDIDLDFATSGRDWIIDYIKYKYGEDKVCQLITFATMKGRGSLKDIFRVKNIPNYFEIANNICSLIPAESTIVDEIQTEIDGGDENYNAIKWSLDHVPEMLEHYEKYKDIFDQAIRVESTKRGKGKHPSGIVVTNKPYKECFPMDFDAKTKTQIAAFDMRLIEKVGYIKFDVLGISLLDKLKDTQELVNARR